MNKKNIVVKLMYLLTLILVLVISINVFLVVVARVHIRSNTDLKPYINDINVIDETIFAKRGYIFDRNGNIVAQDLATYDVVCVLDKNRIAEEGRITYVDDPVKTAKVLADVLGVDETNTYNLLTQEGLYQTEIGANGRNISKEKKEELAEYNLPGVEFRASIERNYPVDGFAPYVVGLARKNDDGQTIGLMGIEAAFDENLKGVDGKRRYQADKNGFILPGMKEEIIPAKNGDNIYLTIDKGVQDALDVALKESVKQFDASDVWASVVEIETGKIIAWGQYPSFDQNEVDIKDYLDRGLQYAYEPGSVFKPIIFSTAMDLNKYDGNKLYDSSSFYFVSGKNNDPVRVSKDSDYENHIDNAYGYSWGDIPIDQGLIRSSNVATSTILSEYISTDDFYNYVKKFGFFEEVGVDRLDEVIGQHNFNYAVEKLNMAFGQGISTTMMHLLQAYTAIFGDGQMVKPYFVDKIVDSNTNQIKYEHNHEVVGNPIKPETAKKIQALMRRVVTDPNGTGMGYEPKNSNITILAKTGTSQVAMPSGGYDPYLRICSSIIAFPADNPKYMLYYATKADFHGDSPHYVNYPVVRLLIKASRILDIEDKKEDIADGKVEITKNTMPNLINDNMVFAKEKLDKLKANVIIIGDGNNIIKQYPSAGSDVYTKEKVFILTDGANIILPDFEGWSRKEITSYWMVSDLDMVIKGQGVVVKQNIDPKTPVDHTKQIEIILEDIRH